MEEIKILPEKALDLLIAGIPPADILDVFEDVPEPTNMMSARIIVDGD